MPGMDQTGEGGIGYRIPNDSPSLNPDPSSSQSSRYFYSLHLRNMLSLNFHPYLSLYLSFPPHIVHLIVETSNGLDPGVALSIYRLLHHPLGLVGLI